MSRHFAGIATLGLFFCLLNSQLQAGRVPGKPPSEAEMERWWNDLELDEVTASRALLNFSDWPVESVAFLKGKMKPLMLKDDRLDDLLVALGDKNEHIWKPAFEELEYFDPRLSVNLEALMDSRTKTPARQRLVEILSGREAESLAGKEIILRPHGGGQDGPKYFNFFDGRGSWWAEPTVSKINSASWGSTKKKWTRAVRAIVLLEHIHSKEALAILKEMATGHADALPTRTAKEAVERLSK